MNSKRGILICCMSVILVGSGHSKTPEELLEEKNVVYEPVGYYM